MGFNLYLCPTIIKRHQKMSRIRNVIFDFGGVIVRIDFHQAVKRCMEIGIKQADRLLDPYTQSGVFGDLECGKITEETFCRELSRIAGHELSWKDCQYFFLGYFKELPRRNLEALLRLRNEGYRVLLLSNTNPFVMDWVMGNGFDGEGHSLMHYLDRAYLSYQCGIMKPDERLFQLVLDKEQIKAGETLFVDDGPKNIAAAQRMGFHTLCPNDGDDWTKPLFGMLQQTYPTGALAADGSPD